MKKMITLGFFMLLLQTLHAQNDSAAIPIQNKSAAENWQTGENGLEYLVYPKGTGSIVNYGNYIQMHYQQIYKGSRDTIFADSREQVPVIEKMDSASAPASYVKILTRLKRGDSLVLRNLVSGFYRMAPDKIPPFMEPTGFIYTTISIVNAFDNPAAVDSANTAEKVLNRPRQFEKDWNSIETEYLVKCRAQFEKDDKIITGYLDQKKIKAAKAKWGSYISIQKEGTGKLIGKDDRVSLNYSGKVLNSNENFDSNIDPKSNLAMPYPVIMCELNNVILGWYDALFQMKKGTKATIYIPSSLGYGTNGSPPRIKPDEILVFEMEILNVEKIK